jgi:hypothetical protein
MKNLFEPQTVAEVQTRISKLQPDSQPMWGGMNAAQAAAHCSGGLEWAVGDTVPPSMFFGRMVGKIIKPMVFKDDAPMRRNSPTAKSLVIADQRELSLEQERLSGLIDRFVANGSAGCTAAPHSFFGRLTPDEWAILMYKHVDHHLRQFGV